jgi:hypothetical protein
MTHLPKAAVRALAIGIVLLAAGCVGFVRRAPASSEPDLRELWVAPDDLSARDLFYGPGGAGSVPDAAIYQYVQSDHSGASPVYHVTDGSGRKWTVKLGIEAQPEVVVSRILWAIGYYQPTMYYRDRWVLAGLAQPMPAGRFRLERPDWKKAGEWSWFRNPFVGTTEYGGLIAANLLLNNWDWKTSNNEVYDIKTSGAKQRAYVVKDLGASLGRAYQLTPLNFWDYFQWEWRRKNDIKGFESQAYVQATESGRLRFDYEAHYGVLVRQVSAPDVRWVCGLLSRLSDQQLEDAFRAADYDAVTTERYVRKLRQKIAEGLAVPVR